eukprot:TRINITY_DN78727_c0_g1_i1.p2 TRINITY_DN78727_c0_g1~~TRINITY_DN78727_c0_g1_i1.p2  ORF type:complete len:181 (+),score=80.91 TRINITY_DN78727_c0_g1_i1:28-543(+)
MKNLCVWIAVFAAVAAACQPPDCENVDDGSCGNACCVVDWTFNDMDAVTIADKLNTTLSNGGPDGRYTLATTAEAPTQVGFLNLMPYNLTTKFIGQAHHETKVHHYRDVNDWTVRAGQTDKSVIVRGFSTSLIGGALGDAGQNYKNIKQVIEAIGIAGTEKIVFGCGKVFN